MLGMAREDNLVKHEEERMERSVEVLAIILFGVLGLSHILQPKAWAEFFILLRGKGEPGASWTAPESATGRRHRRVS
jgi:hypothetical protein